MADMFAKPAIEFLSKALESWEDVDVIAEKVKNSLDTITAKLYEVYGKIDKAAYKVLNHGDFHFKNVMYRNNATKDEDLLLVDFQFPLWNTPAIDVLYLLNMNASTEVRVNHRDEIILFYYREFVQALKTIGHLGRIPTLLDLQVELLRCGALDYLQNVASVPFHFLDWSKIDFAKMMEENGMHAGFMSIYTTVYAMPEFRAYLKKVLNGMIAKGILE